MYLMSKNSLMSKVIYTGTAILTKDISIEVFDEDDGFVDVKIPSGEYEYRVLDINGWKPAQILLKDGYIDLAGINFETEGIWLA